MYTITDNKYNISPSRLFLVGKRDNNPKRSFLFISKLLGKHVCVSPEVVRASGYMLASLKYCFDCDSFLNCINSVGKPDYAQKAYDDDVLVIGFCETATGLGMSVASAIDGAYFIATTRETITDSPQLLSFEESHSHASTHYMFCHDKDLKDFKTIVLVDDEITTGNSLLHLMHELVNHCNVSEIDIMTILDWRNAEQRAKFIDFAARHSVNVNVYSLLEGYMTDENVIVYHNPPLQENKETTLAIPLNVFDYTSDKIIRLAGRTGISSDDIKKVDLLAGKAAVEIKHSIPTAKTILVLGHGENIYIPSRVASVLQCLGYDVTFRTTSRTPIYIDGEIIKDAERFTDCGTQYHFFNRMEAEQNDLVVLLTENERAPRLCDNQITFRL